MPVVDTYMLALQALADYGKRVASTKCQAIRVQGNMRSLSPAPASNAGCCWEETPLAFGCALWMEQGWLKPR